MTFATLPSESAPPVLPLGPEGAAVHAAFVNSPELSNKHSSYFETYGQLFEQYRGREITFVEIGVFSGGSLFMWRDYLGPKARIIGVEFNPEAKRWESHGFEIHIGSQSDPDFWARFFAQVGPVDIVLDDGGHTYEQQIATVHHCLPHVKNGGLVVVEDTHTSYFNDFGYPSRYTFVEWVKVLFDNLQSRFHGLEYVSRLPYREAIRSIEVFESIVAFKVNRPLCAPSQPVSNQRSSARPEDFRFKEFETSLWFLPASLRQSRFAQRLKHSLAKRASRSHLGRLKKFFR